MEIFNTYITRRYYLESIMKIFARLNYIVIGLEVLHDRSIYPREAFCQQNGSLFVNIDEEKKYYIKSIHLCLKNIYSFLKATQPLQCDAVPWQSEVIAKLRHYKVKLLQSDVTFSNLQLFGNKCKCSFFDLYWQYFPWSSHRLRRLGRYLDL